MLTHRLPAPVPSGTVGDMATTVEIKHQVLGRRTTQISISREIDRHAVQEALELFLTTFTTEQRHEALGQLCRHFNHHEERP